MSSKVWLIVSTEQEPRIRLIALYDDELEDCGLPDDPRDIKQNMTFPLANEVCRIEFVLSDELRTLLTALDDIEALLGDKFRIRYEFLPDIARYAYLATKRLVAGN